MHDRTVLKSSVIPAKTILFNFIHKKALIILVIYNTIKGYYFDNHRRNSWLPPARTPFPPPSSPVRRFTRSITTRLSKSSRKADSDSEKTIADTKSKKTPSRISFCSVSQSVHLIPAYRILIFSENPI